MRRSVALAALLWGCSELVGGLDRVIALEIVGPLAVTVQEGDTLQLHARAIDAAGDSVPDATIVWERVDTLGTAFTLDTATGGIAGVAPGGGQVQARVEALRAGPVTVTVTAAPDGIVAGGEQRIVVPAGDPASAPLAAEVHDLTTAPGDTLPLGGIPVEFTVVESAPGSDPALSLFLAAVGDSVPGTNPLALTVSTAASGRTSAVVRRVAGMTPPDSVTVAAVALTARGDVVAGSPARFVIVFEQS